MAEMARVRAIWDAAEFRTSLAAIESAEVDREFCRHGPAHLLDVARVAQILNLERGAGLDRELIYAAALLHDLGRAAQYATGEPHDAAGERIAREILGSLPSAQAFSEAECSAILAAVRGHRGATEKVTAVGDGVAREGDAVDPEQLAHVLATLIREADHRSRPCYACSARESCYWPEERKNTAPFL